MPLRSHFACYGSAPSATARLCSEPVTFWSFADHSAVTPQQFRGPVAQLVERWIENPCVGNSNLPGATIKPISISVLMGFLFCFFCWPFLRPDYRLFSWLLEIVRSSSHSGAMGRRRYCLVMLVILAISYSSLNAAYLHDDAAPVGRDLPGEGAPALAAPGLILEIIWEGPGAMDLTKVDTFTTLVVIDPQPGDRSFARTVRQQTR